MTVDTGILSTSSSHNIEFIRLLAYHGIKAGNIQPNWGIGNKSFSYYACEGFPDQINLYRFQRLSKGGLNSKEVTYGDCIDNTNTLYMPYKFHISSPWKIPKYVDDDYDECFKNIISQYLLNNSHITILWSGGVDSSAIIAGFIKYGDKHRFSIGYTEASIKEYSVFYDFLQRNNFDLINIDDTINLSGLPGLVVHGGESGVISDNGLIFSEMEILDKPWHYSINKDEWGADYSSLYEFTEKFMINYGKKNSTVADVCIFGNIGTEPSNGTSFLNYDANLKMDKISSFYGNDLITSWNYYHSEKYTRGSHVSSKYKIPAKKIIFSVLKDNDYLAHKYKVPSQDLWKKKCGVTGIQYKDMPHDYFFINSNGERVSADSKQEYLEKYKGRFNHYFNTPLL